MENRKLWIWSGVAGVAGIVCYIVAITVPWPDSQFGTSSGLLVVSGWPVLNIISMYGLYTFVAVERQSMANRLAFVFAALAFATLMSMIIVQNSVGSGIGEITKGLDKPLTTALYRGLRMIDLGLDVAWDFLIGTSLILLGIAMQRRRGFGFGWGIPATAFGVALIILNSITFPWPPGDPGSPPLFSSPRCRRSVRPSPEPRE